MTSRTRTRSRAMEHAVRRTAARTRCYVPEHVGRAGKEHPNAVATDTTDAFGTGVAIV